MHVMQWRSRQDPPRSPLRDAIGRECPQLNSPLQAMPSAPLNEEIRKGEPSRPMLVSICVCVCVRACLRACMCGDACLDLIAADPWRRSRRRAGSLSAALQSSLLRGEGAPGDERSVGVRTGRCDWLKGAEAGYLRRAPPVRIVTKAGRGGDREELMMRWCAAEEWA